MLLKLFGLFFLAGGVIGSPIKLEQDGSFVAQDKTKSVIDELLKRAPIIDGHNDLPLSYRVLVLNEINKVDLNSDLSSHPFWYKHTDTQTDIPRLKASGYGGQFWSIYTECEAQFKDAVEQTLEQIDVMKRIVKKYPDVFQFATSAQDIDDAFKAGKIASLMGVEGGHNIHANYGILRTYYDLGVRYLTLTHNCNNPWADSSKADDFPPNYLPGPNHGLSEWGLGVIDEMNRLGMIVDLSHTSMETMKAALKRSKAPIMFSHSGAKAVFDHPRNVPDDVLELVKSSGSIVMINIYAGYMSTDKASVTMNDVIAHADQIKKVAGADAIGIGCDFDGVSDFPKGLESPAKLRTVLEALYESGWTEEELEKMASGNIRRVMTKVEEIRDSLKDQEPKDTALIVGEYWKHPALTSNFF